MAKPYRRRFGVLNRPSSVRPHLRYVNDGGVDATLSARGRTIFRATIALIVVVGLVLLILSR